MSQMERAMARAVAAEQAGLQEREAWIQEAMRLADQYAHDRYFTGTADKQRAALENHLRSGNG